MINNYALHACPGVIHPQCEFKPKTVVSNVAKLADIERRLAPNPHKDNSAYSTEIKKRKMEDIKFDIKCTYGKIAKCIIAALVLVPIAILFPILVITFLVYYAAFILLTSTVVLIMNLCKLKSTLHGEEIDCNAMSVQSNLKLEDKKILLDNFFKKYRTFSEMGKNKKPAVDDIWHMIKWMDDYDFYVHNSQYLEIRKHLKDLVYSTTFVDGQDRVMLDQLQDYVQRLDNGAM